MTPIPFKGNFIDGQFTLPSSHLENLVSEDPGDLDHAVGEIVVSKDAVNPAVQAARKAFPRWASGSAKERSVFLFRFQKLLKKRAQGLSLLISREMGKNLAEATNEVNRMVAKINISCFDEPRLIRSSSHRIEKGVVGRCLYRPRGVLAILSPFNLPAYLGSYQTFSSLHAGNTVILKPSEITPFVGQFLAELWKETGIPKGVFNLLQGGAEVGRELVIHPGIDGVIFTGSWETGSKIQTALLQKPEKICALEMGGKNAVIILKDADLKAAVQETFQGVFLTTGQRCNATSRIILESKIAQEFLSAFLEKVDAIKIGYGTDPGIFMGPVASLKGKNHILQLIEKAPSEGFNALRGGGEFSFKKRGFYLKPSVYLREGELAFPLKEGSYADDEILGPDAAIYIVKNLEEAIRLNNRSRYGLAASVFTKSRKNFEKVFKEAQNGLINWNLGTVCSSPRLPFGGLKQSGNNRPAGFFTPYLCTIPTASLEKAR